MKRIAIWLLIASALWAERDSKLLFSFESPEEITLWEGPAKLQLTREHSTEGQNALQVDLFPEGGAFVIRAKEPLNLSGYKKLKLDVYREGDPITLNLRVHDKKGNRYVSWYYIVRPGFNVLEYSIWGMESAVDVSQVDYLVLYSEHPRGTLFIDNIRLTRGKDDDSWLLPKVPPKPSIEVSGNLLFNGDFELGMQGWGSWGEWEGGTYIFGSGLGEDAYSGLASVAIICQKPGRGGIYTEPFVLPAGRNKFTFYAKGKGEGVRMFWAFLGTKVETPPEIAQNQRSPRFDVPSQWTKYEYEVIVSEDVEVRLYFFSVGRGTLFIDAVSLVKEGEEKPRVEGKAKVKPSKVEIRGNKVYVNGKIFFPIGIYGGEPEALKGTGFNLIVRDIAGGAGGGVGIDFLNRCQENGIMVSMGLSGLLRAHLPFQAPKAIEPYKDHPAVFAWYICDEPDHSLWTVAPPEVRLATSLLHKADPNHITWAVVMPWADSNIYQYADSVDIITTDDYPFNSFANYEPYPTAHIGKTLGVLKRAVKSQRPIWLVTESYGNVTGEQTYADAYMALVHGAEGLIFFSFEDSFNKPERWSKLRDLSLELKELAPIILSPDSKREVKVDNERIHFLGKEYKGKFYLISVNGSGGEQKGVKFSLPLRGKARVLFEGREVEIKGGVLVDDFAGYQRHVYEIPL